MKKIIKYGLLGIGASVVLLVVIGALAGGSSTSTTTTGTGDTDKPKAWVAVDSLEGSGQKQSHTFHLSGGEAKIEYAYKSNMDEVGVFTVYVEEKGHDISTQGALPVVMTSEANETSSSALTKPEGDYYMQVGASGRYKVILYELK